MEAARASDSLPAPTSDPVVHAIGIPNPFSGRRVYGEVRPGLTLSEILGELGLSPHGPYSLEVWVGASKVEAPWLSRVRPKAGQTVVARLVPHGRTGKAIFSIIIGIGLALFTGGASLAASISYGGFGIGTGALLPTAVGGLIAYSGINSLVNPPPGLPFDGDIPTSNRSPALLGEGNAPTPWEPVVRQYGRYLRFPRYAAKPYTETVGEDTFLRALFDFGYGPLQLTDLKLGETPIDNYQAEYVIHPGYDDDPALTIFANAADEQSIGLNLLDGVDAGFRTTAANTHEVTLDLVFPGGLIGFLQQSGAPHPVSVEFHVEYRESTVPGAWTDAVLREPYAPGMNVGAGGTFAIVGMERGYLARGITFDVPAPGTYDVRVSRTDTVYLPNLPYFPNDDPNPLGAIEDCTWAVMRSIRPATKPRVPNLCLVEMRVKMTDQIQGRIDDFNAMADTILPVWSDLVSENDGWGPANLLSTNTSLQVTRNPAWAYAEHLRGRHNRRRVPNAKIDTDSLAAWASKCDSEGRTFDAVVDFQATIGRVCQDIAGSARASLNRIDGRYGVVVDEPKAAISAHLTSRDTSGFRATKTFPKELHALRVGFVNASKGYQPDEVMVYADGYDEASATEFDRVDLWGVDNSDRAWRDGRYHMAADRLRPEVYSTNIDIQNLRLTRGDRFYFAHDVMLVGLGSARIKALSIVAGKLISITLDDIIETSPGVEYGVVLRLDDGGFASGKIVTPPLPRAQQFLYPIGIGLDVGSLPVQPAVGDVVTLGEFGEEVGDYLVHGVYPGPDISARIEFVDYSPGIFTADTETIPPYDPGITDPRPPPLKVPAVPIITSIASDESVLKIGKDGTVTPVIALGVAAGSGSEIDAAYWMAQYRTSNPVGVWRTAATVPAQDGTILIEGVDDGIEYDVRVRAIGPLNRASDWREALGHFVTGATTPPPDVEQLLSGPEKLLVWQYPSPPRDFAGFRIKSQAGSDSNWLTGVPAHEGLVTETQFDGTLIPAGPRTIMVKAVDLAGNESVNAAVLVADLGGPATENVIESYDVHSGGFTGTKTDCAVDGGTGDLVADTEAGLFWRADGSTFWKTPDSTAFWDQGWKACTYVDSWTPAGASLPGKLEVSLSVTAPAWRLEYRVSGSSTWLRWPGFVQVDSVTTYEFRLLIEASATEPRVTAFLVFIDVPDVVEFQNDVVIAAAGVHRLTLVKTFKVIKQILATVQDTGSGARKLVVKDKQALAGAANGPSVELWDDANPPARVSDQVDFQILGY